MIHYLLVYERSTGRLKECLDLGTDSVAALAERFDRERRESSDPDVEVVLLSAQSRDELMRTHARYFKSVGELAADLETLLPH